MIRKCPALAVLLSIMLLFSGCSKRKASASYNAAYTEEPYVESGYAPAAAYDSAAGGSYSAVAEDALFDSGSSAYQNESAKTESSSAPADSTVRKIIYNAEMSVTADDPAALRDILIEKASACGGYVSSSNSTAGDDGISSVKLQLKVPADHLEELVETANGLAKVKSYHLYSDDISQRYYDIRARLNSAQAEEAQLLELLKRCESIEEILKVRESLASVRSDIESYQGTINLWDHLVSYATLDLTIRRTPKTAVEKEDEPIALWKLSDIWSQMRLGFINSARFMVNAVGAIGIFLAVAVIPLCILFLLIGLPIILHVRKSRKKKAAAALDISQAPEGSESDAASDIPKQE